MWLAFLFKRDMQNIVLHTVIKDIDGLERYIRVDNIVQLFEMFVIHEKDKK